jgi:hypothetical protein
MSLRESVISTCFVCATAEYTRRRRVYSAVAQTKQVESEDSPEGKVPGQGVFEKVLWRVSCKISSAAWSTWGTEMC